MTLTPLIRVTHAGLFCPVGDFYVDPWQRVETAVITHAHADHARAAPARGLCAADGLGLLRTRLGREATIRGLRYGERATLNGVDVTLHPAGHVLGSAQVRIEHAGEVVVISGDYKLSGDPTCVSFEPVRCDTFVSEATFGLPVYRWPEPQPVFDEINAWWRHNQAAGLTSVLFAYALGKAQRVLAGVDASIGPLLVHGAVERLLPAYSAAGVSLPVAVAADADGIRQVRGRGLVIAPPSAAGAPWLRKFAPLSTGFASGWMQVRGARRRRAVDRGFALSDHADWPGLLEAIRMSGAKRIGVTHGYAEPLARYLRERGWETETIATRYAGEADVEPEAAAQEN